MSIDTNSQRTGRQRRIALNAFATATIRFALLATSTAAPMILIAVNHISRKRRMRRTVDENVVRPAHGPLGTFARTARSFSPQTARRSFAPDRSTRPRVPCSASSKQLPDQLTYLFRSFQWQLTNDGVRTDGAAAVDRAADYFKPGTTRSQRKTRSIFRPFAAAGNPGNATLTLVWK